MHLKKGEELNKALIRLGKKPIEEVKEDIKEKPKKEKKK